PVSSWVPRGARNVGGASREHLRGEDPILYDRNHSTFQNLPRDSIMLRKEITVSKPLPKIVGRSTPAQMECFPFYLTHSHTLPFSPQTIASCS
ncbi:mCG145605, partial [Mus musculus]